MKPFDILDRQVPIFGKHFLEASAGTGKTFAIEHLVARLLLESPQIQISQILVMTFTRAATRELKMRIRKTLENLLAALKKQKSSHDYLQAIVERGEEAIEEAKKKLEEALACFDLSQIFTLHGFCHRVLSEFAFEAGIHFDVSDPDAKEHRALLKGAIKDFFRSKVHKRYLPQQVERVLNKHRQDFKALESKLLKLIEGEQKIASFATASELLAQFNAELLSFPPVQATGFLEEFKRLFPRYNRLKGELFFEQVWQLGLLLEKKSCKIQEFQTLLSHKEWAFEKMHKGNTKARFKEESLDMGVFDSIRERLLPLLQEAVDPLKILLQMAGDCKRGAEELLGIAEKTTPDALLLKMEQALQLPDFVFKVRQKYRAVIIDEFQDTDKVQWNIFKTLFLCAEYTVDTFCVVGDPKQSIYGFRNADIYTYLEAASHMGKESMKCLTTNYRSDTSLVTALNRLLSTKHLPGWMTLPSQGMSLDIAEVSSVHPSEPGEKGSLHFFIAEGRCMRDKWPTEQVEEECFFPFIATEIARLSSEGVANPSIPYKEMAVLVRDRYQAERLHGYLEKAGIPSAVRQGARIALSIGYLASLQLLQAVQDPHDISVLKSVLGGPLIGWTAEQLRDEAAVAKEKERFILYKEQCQSQGCGPLFQEFLSLQLDLKLRLELRQIAELLLERKTKADLTSCIQFLQEIRQSDPDEFLYRIEADEQSVPILTIHMSKGLEFEIIFALGVASRTTSKQEIIRVRDNLTLFEEEKKECREALLEQDAEKMRQLYVALTRAKNRVYIPLAFDLDERPPDLGKASPIELFCSHLYAHHTKEKMAKPSLKHLLPLLDEIRSECHITYEILTPQQEIPSLSVPRTSFATCAEPPPVHLCIPREQILSFSSLTSKGDIPKRIQIEIPSRALEIEKNPHTMPLGVETGSLIHGILEKLFLQGLHHPLQMARIASLIQQEVRLSSLQGWEEVITQMVKSVVEMPLPLMPKHTQNLVSGQPRGFGAACLKEVAREKMLQEMEFLFPYEGSLMKGFADLIFEYNHRYYLLDWKTNYLGATDADYTVENIEKAMLEHNYFLQASIYSQALQRYVKLFDTRPFSECFGGAIYLFLRGKTAYHFLPDGDICCYTQKT